MKRNIGKRLQDQLESKEIFEIFAYPFLYPRMYKRNQSILTLAKKQLQRNQSLKPFCIGKVPTNHVQHTWPVENAWIERKNGTFSKSGSTKRSISKHLVNYRPLVTIQASHWSHWCGNALFMNCSELIDGALEWTEPMKDQYCTAWSTWPTWISIPVSHPA